MNLKRFVSELDKKLDALRTQVLEGTLPHMEYLILSGKYRGIKSVRDQLADALQKQQMPSDPEIDSLDADEPPEPRRRLNSKPRSW